MKKRRLVIGSVAAAVIVISIIATVIPFRGERKMISAPRVLIRSVTVTKGNTGDGINLSSEEMDELVALCRSVECKERSLWPYVGWSYKIDITGIMPSSTIVISGEKVCKINGSDYEIREEDREAVGRLSAWLESFFEKDTDR